MNNQDKYNEIIVLVHPLYDALHYQPGFLNTTPDTKKKLIAAIRNDKSELARVKTTLLEYSKVLSLVKKHKPNTLFVVINKIYEEPTPETNSEIKANKEFTKSFFNLGKEKLGARFISRTYDPDVSGYNVLFPENIYKRLNKDIKLKVFGEYLELCVKDWADFINKDLKKRGFNVLESRIIKHRSLSRSPTSTLHSKIIQESVENAFIKQENLQKRKWAAIYARTRHVK